MYEPSPGNDQTRRGLDAVFEIAAAAAPSLYRRIGAAVVLRGRGRRRRG